MESVLLGFVVAVAGALAGALATRVLSTRKERLDTTLGLFRRYHSRAMLDARRRAWGFLTKEYGSDPVPWRGFFADSGDPGNVYGSLARVVYFWQLLHTVREAGDLDEGVARGLFAYQFGYWREALEPLVRATAEDAAGRGVGGRAVDWLVVFEDGAMDWLLAGDGRPARRPRGTRPGRGLRPWRGAPSTGAARAGRSSGGR